MSDLDLQFVFILYKLIMENDCPQMNRIIMIQHFRKASLKIVML